MGRALGHYLRKAFGGIAFAIFLAMSGYMLLALVVALSDQGLPTGAVVPVTIANPVYPEWDQAPGFLTALSVALVAYPIAAVFYGIGRLCSYFGRRRPEPGARMLPEVRELPELPAEPGMDVYILGAALVVRSVPAATARLFGLTPREMIGLSVEGFIAPRDLSKFAALLLAAHGQSGQTVAARIGIRQPDDRVVPVDVTCHVAADAGSAGPGSLVLSFHPLSERDRLDHQLAANGY